MVNLMVCAIVFVNIALIDFGGLFDGVLSTDNFSPPIFSPYL